ncbi:3-deoxy-7-phosphoheptulonate synthase [Kitasatospora sp. NPDC001540]|uniref:3-deoxy-7-phosphoheptulonate synthase n=1 Tax=Kitasatospora sp. NPDC001540 TaxID=3364014 RepID=UPI0036B103BE
MDTAPPTLATRPALQQPDWADHPLLPTVRTALAALPPLVDPADTAELRTRLAEAAAGRALVLQTGDCAEDPAECTVGDVARKTALLDDLAELLTATSGLPVLRVGRLAGQYAKPRSRPTEQVDGREVPVYRGHLVNDPEPDPELRRPDPGRVLPCYLAAAETLAHLGRPDPARRPPVWVSHEALLLDYEEPQLRTAADGTTLLASTHWPWIGERTRDPEGAHVALLAAVANPVACKIGPGTTPDQLRELCARLDPHREPGRLTLIARMGADRVADRLPALVRAALDAGHPAAWLTDPMHGNTFTAPGGLKTRLVATVVQEVRRFQEAVRAAGGTAAGLHLETTPDDVTECADDASAAHVGDKYTSLCDPRLNPAQARTVVAAWRA